MNLHNKTFRTVSNTENGDVDAQTLFYYKQQGDIIMATYSGGSIVIGSLIAMVTDEKKLNMHYHHITINGQMRAGVCVSTPEILPDGRIRLYEDWTWTTGDFSSGTSIIEEFHAV